MFYAYVLKSMSTDMHYIGQTANLEQRISAHNIGDSRYTKNRGPWILIYFEEFDTRSQAMLRERFFKTGKGREFLKNNI